MATPPDYVADKLVPPEQDGPAQYLVDGKWCGHGEPLFEIYDVEDDGVREFAILLPAPREGNELMVPAVKVTNAEGTRSFTLYDPKRHPANLFASARHAKLEPRFAKHLVCLQCQGGVFRVAVGFEIPSDSSSPNDTSWFALAAICVGCGAAGIVFDDETA